MRGKESSILKTAWRILVRLALIVLGFGFLVVLLAKLTWFLGQQGQKADIQHLAIAIDTNHQRFDVAEVFPSQMNLLSPQVDLSQTDNRIHTVSEWTGDRNFHQAPMLENTDLPTVADRLPRNPLVIHPPDQNGPYGGTWQRYGTSAPDVGIFRDRLAYDGLVRWGPMAQQILPNLAVRWEITDQGRTYTFWLREGVRWSDGTLFSVDDILFWYNHVIKNPDLTPTIPREYQRDGVPMEVEKIDDTTVRFRFAGPYGLFLNVMASGRSYPMVEYPAHYLKQFHPDFTDEDQLLKMARKKSLDFWYQLFEDRADWQNTEIPRLWPWLVKVPPPANAIVFRRNPYYWKVDGDGNQLPYVDRMTFEIYDTKIINMKAMNGEVGMQGRHLQFDNYPKFKLNSQERGYSVRLWISSGGGTALALNLNHKDPVLGQIFADRRFRIALSHAIDRQQLNEIAFFGIGQPCQVSPLPISPFYSESYESAYTTYDPAQANRLLDQMGLFRRNKDGIRLRPDGKPIHLRIELASVFFNIPMFQLVAQQWSAVGIKTELKLEARQLFSTRRSALLYDVGVWGSADELMPLIDPKWFFPCGNGSLQGIGYARWFLSNGKQGVTPPEKMQRCMSLYRQIEKTPDPQEQVRLFQQIIELNRENLWVIGTVSRVPSLFVVKDTFRNVPQIAVAGWLFRTPGSTAPECYAIDEGTGNRKRR